MATKQYFNNFTYANEQALIDSLVTESIKEYGIDVHYIPRTIVKDDHLFGEDVLSSFNTAAAIEVYIKNVEGFGGEGDFLSKFNLEIRDSITFCVSRTRFSQFRTEKVLSEMGWNIKSEEGDLFLLEEGSSDGYSNIPARPMEGDLLYFPLNGKIFEIMFVEHEPVFYQMGKQQFYEMRCELFEYSSERFATGNTAIDSIENIFNLDELQTQIELEDGSGSLEDEEDGSLIQEFRIETVDKAANNELFQEKGEDIIDYSEQSPFSQIDRF